MRSFFDEGASVAQWRTVYSLFTNCFEVSVFGSYWKTRYLVVCEQTCSCGREMEKSCDQRLAHLISYIHHTSEYRQYCDEEAQHNSADLDCFRSDFRRRPGKTRNQHQEVSWCIFGVTRLCQQVGCVRNRLLFHTVLQKLKSFLSTAGLRIGRYSRSHSLGFGD